MKEKVMKTVTVKNITIGEGIPKICVPLVGVTEAEIVEEARLLRTYPADLVEWRADWFAKVQDTKKVLDVLKRLREVLEEIPLLFTFRTKKEGGEAHIEPENYIALNEAAAQSGFVDLIDVELFLGEEIVRALAVMAHACGVIVSNHDFVKTPKQEEILQSLCKMQQLDADILKIAVMPQNKADVLKLLTATEEMYTNYADRPIVTMSMGADGLISRLSGEFFGSAITFGAIGKASAPGQMPVEQLAQILAQIHEGTMAAPL